MKNSLAPALLCLSLALDAACASHLDAGLHRIKRSHQSIANKRKLNGTTLTLHKRATPTDTQPDNLAEGAATADEGCSQWVQPLAGDSCFSVIALVDGLVLEDFYGLNPSVDSDCSNLRDDLSYCIDTTDDDAKDAKCAATKADNGTSKKTTEAVTNVAPAAAQLKVAEPKKEEAKKVTVEKVAEKVADKVNDAVGDVVSGVAGLLKMTDPTAGFSNPSDTCSSNGGVNGAFDWLTNGLSGGGWAPPHVTVDMLRFKSLDSLGTDGYFAPCKPFVHIFDEVAKKYNFPSILLASIAMVESTCNPDVMGDNGGAYGLMQITEDKCGGAPNGNCRDVYYNIDTGAKYLQTVLGQFNGNILTALGAYNGWYQGLTVDKGTAARWSSCCVCQNNLDYINQIVNCNMQGESGANGIKYNNLKDCH